MRSETAPVEDSVPKVNNELAVGSDLAFQKKWWRFEQGIWMLFAAIIFLDLIGCFGRGWLANAGRRSRDGSLTIEYERVQRMSTPSRMLVLLQAATPKDGVVQLWVSKSLLQPLGNQRVIPQPLRSEIRPDGIIYSFPVSGSPAAIEFALEPGKIGVHEFQLRMPGSDQVSARVLVLP